MYKHCINKDDKPFYVLLYVSSHQTKFLLYIKVNVKHHQKIGLMAYTNIKLRSLYMPNFIKLMVNPHHIP